MFGPRSALIFFLRHSLRRAKPTWTALVPFVTLPALFLASNGLGHRLIHDAIVGRCMSRYSRWKDLLFPVGIIASVLVILVPMPTFLMDVLLAANITIAVIVLLTTIYVRTPLEFSVFPSLLLATTLGRLVLNVASTRLILTHAET